MIDEAQPGWFARHRTSLSTGVSGFVGALALATSTYNVYLQRQQVRAQVWPRLTLSTNWDDGKMTFQVQNRGVGPASVKRVRVLVDDRRAADWISALAALLRTRSYQLPSINEIENEVMSPGFEIAMLKMEGPDALTFLQQRRRLKLEICYCSTLDECWLLQAANPGEASVTTPIGECAQDTPPFASVAAATWDQILARPSPDAGTPAAGKR